MDAATPPVDLYDDGGVIPRSVGGDLRAEERSYGGEGVLTGQRHLLRGAVCDVCRVSGVPAHWNTPCACGRWKPQLSVFTGDLYRATVTGPPLLSESCERIEQQRQGTGSHQAHYTPTIYYYPLISTYSTCWIPAQTGTDDSPLRN